jgi:hypothetical protein
MAATKIQTDFDLSGSAAFATTAITDPNNANLSWKITGATDETQVVNLEWWIKVGDEDSHQMPHPVRTGDVAISKAKGNESDNTNFAGINATELKIKIVPPSGADGTLNLWVNNS